MQKTGKIISDVEVSLSINNIDDLLPRRYIYNVLLDETYKLIRQKKNIKNLFKDSKLVNFLDCVDMVRINASECCGFKGDVMRSKERIEAINITSGDAILGVYTVDDESSFDNFDNFRQFNENRERRFGSLQKGYIYNDGYIYVLGAFPKAINVVLIKDPNKVLNDLEKDADSCEAIYDIEFPCPDDLVPFAKAATVQFIMATSKQIREDENANLDSNIRSKDNPVNI